MQTLVNAPVKVRHKIPHTTLPTRWLCKLAKNGCTTLQLALLLTQTESAAPEVVFSAPQKGEYFKCLAAAAKSLQSCPTLCDPRDDSPPGSSVPGILQARTLEWVAISFSNA